MQNSFPRQYSFAEKVVHKLFAEARELYERTHPGCISVLERTINHEEAGKIMYDCLSADKPCMIARFGGNEMNILTNYLGIQRGFKGCWDFVRAKQEQWWWMSKRVDDMINCSGFFPREEWAFNQFSQLLLEDMKYIDVLACFTKGESYFKETFSNVPKLHLLLMEPWFASQPWTRVLKGKKVLVVHPFAELIEYQYKNTREKLFPGTEILPDFELHTVKAVQSLGGNNDNFSSWFDALDWMKAEMDKQDYDYCLIGCGAYGLHLAAHAKRMGKKAVHLGGVLQLLFGIKGNRWEDPNYGLPSVGIPYGWYLHLFNEFWTKPDSSYRPKNAQQVEGACYW